MIKNNLLVIIATLAFSISAFSQNNGIRLIDFNLLEQGKFHFVEANDNEGKEVGKLIFQKRMDGKTDISIQLTSTRIRGVKVEYFRNKEVFHTERFDRGPSGLFDMSIEKEVIHTEAFNIVDQDNWIWGILSAAYCCVQLSVGEEITTGPDGDVISTSTSWSLGFDCDCFGSITGFIGPNGENYGDVDSVVITAM